jgi:ABC-type branched-subunit amino acid transport system permease subunit
MNQAARALLGPALLVAAVAGAALTLDSRYWLGVATTAGIFAIAAIGLNLLFGGSGQISVGHAGFLGIGAWTGGALMAEQGLPFPVAALAAMAAAGLAGVVVGYAALRLAGWYLSLATAAFGLVVAEVIRIRMPQGIFGVPPVELGPIEIISARDYFLLVWTFVIVTYLFVRGLSRSRFGRALGALRDDPVAAASCGVNLARAKVTVFTLSAMATGLAGALHATAKGSVFDASFNFFVSVDLLLMIVVGGLGSPMGAIFGALFFTVLPEFGRAWEEIRLTAFGFLLILVIVGLPRGIAGIGASALGLARLARRPRVAQGIPGGSA